MKIMIQLDPPTAAKKWALRIGVPVALLLGGGAVAWAAGLKIWNAGDTLTAADLNANFAYVQSEIAGGATSLAAGGAAGGLTRFAVMGGTITTTSATCAKGAFASVPNTVVCSCPAGSYVVSGGAWATTTNGTADNYLRESRPYSTTQWAMTCINTAGDDVICGEYDLLCSRLGP